MTAQWSMDKQYTIAQHLPIQNTGGLVEYPVKDAPRVQKAANQFSTRLKKNTNKRNKSLRAIVASTITYSSD